MPVKELRQLKIEFPTPDLGDYYNCNVRREERRGREGGREGRRKGRREGGRERRERLVNKE